MMELIYRFEPNGDKQWLKVTKNRNIIIIEGKLYPEHSYLINTESAGNAYHGRCSNCGLPFVTDLGYCSWKGVQCKTESKKIVTIDYKFTWHKSKEKATKLNKKDVQKHFSTLINNQGWGKYNFQTIVLN